MRRTGRFEASAHAARGLGALLATVLLWPCTLASADRQHTARGALSLATIAADAWVDDARLVWVENDTPVDAQGTARAWAYLFYSESLGAMRSWSVRDGKLQKPEDHSVRAAAPGLHLGWMDSNEIVQRVQRHAGNETGPTLPVSLILVAGVFDAQATWVAVFERGEGPRLHLVLRAADGDLVRRWRG